MDRSVLESADWYNAATLTERAEAFKAVAAPSQSDSDAAAEILQLWRQQSPFESDSWFSRRLELDGISQDLFLRILGEPADAIKSAFAEPPSWVGTVAEALFRPRSRESDGALLPEEMRGAQSAGFLNLVWPFVRLGIDAVETGAEVIAGESDRLPFTSTTISSLLASSLPWQLHLMISRTLVLELNIARIEGTLEGEKPEQRFNCFVERLSQPDHAVALLSQYPVLARRITNCIRKWTSFCLEFLRHLAVDWNAIRCEFFADHEPGMISDVQLGAGDTHRDGRSVVLVTFSSGSRIVYKPRSLAVDRHFQDLLAWLNEELPQPGFRTLEVLDRGDHGWVEFVDSAACGSVDQVGKFYERQGCFLALLYALEATDFHFENLIAAGEYPVLIDLESLFHPRTKPVEISQPDLKLVSDEIAGSVLRIGLLPKRSWSDQDYEGVDLSGLGGAAGQLTPDRLLQWEGIGTDEMRAHRARMAMPGAQNRPALNAGEIDPLDYADAVASGFSRMYRLLLERRDRLLSDGGPLASFEKDTVRAILRPTRVYGLLLHESYHPDMLRDGLELDRFLDRIWVGADEAPFLADVIASERRDLANDDIPVFSVHPNSRDVWDSTGRRIPDFLAESGLESVKRRITQLSEEDLRRQLWFVQASMATLILESEKLRWPRYTVRESEPVHREELGTRLIGEALAVGDRLARLALRDNNDLTWIGLSYANKRWSLVPLQEDLYAGSSGVILALAYLGAITRVGRFTEIAQLALSTLEQRLETSGRFVKGIGAFNGLGSLVYLFSHLGALWNQPSLFSKAGEILDRIFGAIDADQDLDIVGGAAGCIGAVAALHKCVPSNETRRAVVACGEHLLSRAARMDEGIAWFSRIETTKPIAGFSHGSSGIAWSLSKAWELTSDERFKTAAIEAVIYEHTQLVPSEGNWRNPESNEAGREDKLALSVAWCYGAPGVGLARLQLLRCLEHRLLSDELGIAIDTTLKRGFGTNHSLCHGALGNLDFLLQAALATNDSELRNQVDLLCTTVLESMRADGWLCGVPLGVESPSLMNGLSGICYGLLRLAQPDRVPSVLTLEPPL